MYKLFITLLLTCSLSLIASEINWAKDYSSGMESAKKLNKPVFFVSSRHTCRYCVQLDNTTFKDDKVIKELNKSFISIIAYSDEKDYMPPHLWTPGTPALWFLLPNGTPMYQPLMGAIDTLNFLDAIAIVKEDFNKGKDK
ncbi:thioredoxin family protein [Sulfurimonas sp.]|nr:thioredoxin family protein [Sulfurimonas sp.]